MEIRGKGLRRFAMGVLGALMTGGLASTAWAVDGEAVMVHGGNNPAALPCITCHGADAKGIAASGFPRLAGLPAAYIVKQLHDFRADRRMNPVMQPIAKALTEPEIAGVAEFLAARPRVNVAASTPTAQPLPGSGEWIALRGAWSRNIPECTLCHGPSGLGVGNTFPPLAGQSAAYLESQLWAWKGRSEPGPRQRNGKPGKPVLIPSTRHNDPNGLMAHIAASLTGAEIKSLAEYFGSMGDSDEPFDDSQHRLR